ncbi:DUF805 domain-containing protein [Motilimonas pumila]|uniref:DUF805 domain-containing protein n=1 Tax=Motilimonas pumila TaxID=2303987 RepID=A0A418YCJ2_9GAMM|nr:DUF805 domain-containing protein [Motilimonas pumila]RJG42195.1 DUF805 domain-containing protein [Motilimonas pumila]
MQWYINVWKNAFNFSGRARRKEYWMFYLINMLVSLALVFVDMAISGGSLESGVGILSIIYSFILVIPALAVTFRRLHDTSRSAWWILICLIPLVGAIILLIFMVLDSSEDENKWGENPKAQ